MIQLQARNTFAVGKHRRLRQCTQLSAVNKGFQDVLLDIVVVVDYRSQPPPKFGEVLDGFVDAVVVHVVGSWLSAEQNVVAYVLFNKASSVVAADDRIGQIQVFDDGLEFTP